MMRDVCICLKHNLGTNDKTIIRATVADFLNRISQAMFGNIQPTQATMKRHISDFWIEKPEDVNSVKLWLRVSEDARKSIETITGEPVASLRKN